MKTKKWIKASMLLMVAALFAACASEDIAQDKKKENGTEVPKGGVVFATNDTKISAKRRFIDEDEFAGAKTRTNIKHTPGQGAEVYWTSDDFIWVKDKNGNWQQSTAITLHDGGASAEFTLPGNKTDYADGCEVRYTGNSSSSYSAAPTAVNVGFPWSQSRTAPNDFSKAGDWGDCGSGVARYTGNPDKFNFTLSHKSAYLCFLPRCENTILAPNIRLKSINITAIAGYVAVKFAGLFSFDGENIITNTPAFNNKIIITLPDFSLSTVANQAANATYLAVTPGTYDFKIDYTIKDPMTNVETVITDTRTNITLDKGNIYDVTANLLPNFSNPRDYRYYMWDAQQDCWHGYESEQPIFNYGEPGGTIGQHYPKDNTDARWYNETHSHGARYDAQGTLFKMLPNANELAWYVKKGDPHWVSTDDICIIGGHLQHVGGLWLKKKSAIIAYLKANGYPSIVEDDLKNGYRDKPSDAPVDYRVLEHFQISNSPTLGPPANTTDYFFLPAAGLTLQGMSLVFGSSGRYWSSSAYPYSWGGFSFALNFTSNIVEVLWLSREYGFLAVSFE